MSVITDKDAAIGPELKNHTARARAIRDLKGWIADGRLTAGERLPPEQKLAVALRVSRPTVRAALRELESDGFLRPLARRGRVVARSSAPVTAKSMMADAIAILSDAPSDKPSPGQRVHGWESFIQTGAQQLIGERGQHFMMLHPDRLAGDGIERLMGDPPSGIIALRDVALTASGKQVLARLKAHGVPLVVYGDGRELEVYDRVVSDHRAGSYELTRYLLSRGCKRILRYWTLAGDHRPVWLDERDAGYQQALREAGVEEGPMVQIFGYPFATNVEEGRQQHEMKYRMAIGYLWPHVAGANPIDAIIASSDGTTFSIAAGLRILGKQPNRDVLIAGYDNYWIDSPERAVESAIPLVTVDKQNVNIGRRLVEMLQARLTGQLPVAPQRWMVKPQMVVTAAVSAAAAPLNSSPAGESGR